MPSDPDLKALRTAAEAAAKMAPQPWGIDTQRKSEPLSWEDEYTLFDSRGYALCSTENCDWRIGLIEAGYRDEKKAPRRFMEYLAAVRPDAVLHMLDAAKERDALRGRVERMEAALKQAAQALKPLAQELDRIEAANPAEKDSSRHPVRCLDLRRARLALARVRKP